MTPNFYTCDTIFCNMKVNKIHKLSYKSRTKWTLFTDIKKANFVSENKKFELILVKYNQSN